MSFKGFAISGRAGSGKSTLAAHLIEALGEEGLRAERVSFGDALKAEVYNRFGLTKDDPGGRDLLVRYGEQKRLEDPLYWVRPFAGRARAVWQDGGVVVCDDLRFLSELGWCHASGMSLVRLEVPPHVCASRIAQPPDPRSPGERELSAWGRWHHILDEHFGPLNLRVAAEQLVTLLQPAAAA